MKTIYLIILILFIAPPAFAKKKVPQVLTPEPQKEIVNAVEVINLEKVINFDELKENSVLLLKFSVVRSVTDVIRVLAQRYGEQLRSKNISVIVISSQDSVETLDEEKMNELGWHKKGKIITLN